MADGAFDYIGGDVSPEDVVRIASCCALGGHNYDAGQCIRCSSPVIHVQRTVGQTCPQCASAGVCKRGCVVPDAKIFTPASRMDPSGERHVEAWERKPGGYGC